MSIINQALQKAQREQLRHGQQEMPYRLPARMARGPRRRWFLALPGLVAAVGVGATLHTWVLPPTGRVPVRTESVATSSSPVALVLPAAPLPTTAPVQTRTEPPPSEDNASPPAMVSESQQLVPVVMPQDSLSAPAASMPTVSVSPLPPAAVPLPRVVPPAAVATAPAPLSTPLTGVAPTATPSPAEMARAQELVQRAALAQDAKELPRALSLLEQAIKLDPTAKAAYNSLGNVYYQQRRYQQAMAMYQKALAIDPDYTKARNNLGSTYMQLAMDARAIDELHKALQADSSYSLTYYNLACVYARSGNSSTAAQYLQQAITLEPQARTWAQTDTDFARVRSAPEVQQLLGP